MLTIRLTRVGAKKKPSYRVVVIEKERARDGRFLEIVGHYNPLSKPPAVKLDLERIRYWVERGAQPSDRVRHLMEKQGQPEPQVA